MRFGQLHPTKTITVPMSVACGGCGQAGGVMTVLPDNTLRCTLCLRPTRGRGRRRRRIDPILIKH